MAVHHKKTGARSKSENSGNPAVAVQEEIEVKLGPAAAEPDQLQHISQEDRNATAAWMQEIDTLKRLYEKTQNEIAALQKLLQAGGQKPSRELEPDGQEQDEKGQQRGEFDDGIRQWESNPAQLEKTCGDAEHTAAGHEQSSQKKSNGENGTVLKDVRAELLTITHATASGIAVETTVQLLGTDAIKLTHQKVPFQLAWFARRFADGVSFTLGASMCDLAPNQLRYSATAEAANLKTGTYRLTTVITFPNTRQLVASYQGPIFQINEV